MGKIGIITEQNDLGLGFDNLNESDQHAYDEAMKPTKDQQQVINEGNTCNHK